MEAFFEERDQDNLDYALGHESLLYLIWLRWSWFEKVNLDEEYSKAKLLINE